MFQRFIGFSGRLSRRLPFWAVFGWAWLANLLLLAVMIAFRAVKTSGIAHTFEFEDVPLLHFLDVQFPWLVLAMLLSGICLGFFLLSGAVSARKENRPFPYSLLVRCGLMWGLGAIACRFTQPEPGLGVNIETVGVLDWLTLLLACAAAWSLLDWMAHQTQSGDLPPLCRPPRPEHSFVRMSLIYLLGCASIAIFTFREHTKFWDVKRNGGFDYLPFFLPEEIEQANWLFYSTSLLFASLAALGGCAAYLSLTALSRSERRTGEFFTLSDARRQALVLALFWSAALSVPWEVKILPEIISNDGWILPAVTLGFSSSALMPLLMVSGLSLRRDFESSARRSALLDQSPSLPRRSEMAFWNFLLFPVYPWIRLLYPKRTPAILRAGGLMILTALMVGTLTWVFQKADELFDFDDWRGMLNSGLFPCLQVLMSLLAACWVYLAGSQILGWFQRKSAEPIDSPLQTHPIRSVLSLTIRLSAVGLALGALTAASWPFWGWHQISENVFARAVEFSDRHEFEIRFLHWLFDADRDGYAAVLHGADPDDTDPNIQAGGLKAPQIVPVHIDQFEIADAEKAKSFPNVAIFYLEGVTCRSISAYGKRNLPNGLIATPHMDSIAREGTMFTDARCYYPSTWDGWFAVNCGRFLRIQEMHAGSPFGDRYSRYNNLYKVLKLAGINRWCHADTEPYFDLFVPEELRHEESTAWKSGKDYNSSVSSEEEDKGIWRGDKRAERIVEFIDSIEPGERFFFCEHMSDTHFPWEHTPDDRAAELGFPEGLEIYEADAVLPRGGKHIKYSRYLQTITRMDAQIGTILKKLKEKNLYDNTIIVIVSDHGCQWFEHEHMYYVSHLYEQSLEVPLIIKAPSFPQGRVSHEPVLQIDVLPTLMELAGIRHANPTPEYPMTCQSLVPLLYGKDVDSCRYQNRDMILCTHYDMLGVISNFKHKMIFDRPTGTFMVFDLKNDPGETINLADTRPDLKAQLLEKLRVLAERNASFIGQIKASPARK